MVGEDTSDELIGRAGSAHRRSPIKDAVRMAERRALNLPRASPPSGHIGGSICLKSVHGAGLMCRASGQPDGRDGLRSLSACRSASMASLSLVCSSRVLSTVLCRSMLLSSVRSRSMLRSSVPCRSAFLSSVRCRSAVRSRLRCTSRWGAAPARSARSCLLGAGACESRLRQRSAGRCVALGHPRTRGLGLRLGTPATLLAWPAARPASPPGSAPPGARQRLAGPGSPRTGRSALLCCPRCG